jgi:pyruvate, water dikinase
MDMEWAKDGETGEMFIVQARPETVQSRAAGGTSVLHASQERASAGEGLAIGDAIVAGPVCLIERARATSTASSTARSW